MDQRHFRDDTICILAGREPARHDGSVSPPVDRAATRLFEDLPSIEAAHATGRLSAFLGSQTPEYLADAIAALEGSGAKAIVTSSGMSALSIVFLAVLSAGDHLLAPDNVFGPTRTIADDLLARMGIETSYYDPTDVGALADRLRANTRLVLTESPGSNTFEVSDIPAIAATAHAAGALVAIDNSWATPYLFKPLQHGVDFSICAATKYLLGHSDAIIGSIATTDRFIKRIQDTARQLGDGAGADDAWLTLRGMRTLPLRMRRHDQSARQIAEWLADRPGVRQVLHPALPTASGHALWQRDFTGASGLFGLLVEPLDRARLETFINSLQLFRLGYSWGGFESLALPIQPDATRKTLAFPEGSLIRIHVGLEDPQDLVADLDGAFRAAGL